MMSRRSVPRSPSARCRPDRDPEAIAAARARLGETSVRYLTAPFAAQETLAAVTAFQPDRVLLDLGLSSHQVDSADRGFTFRPGAPLDMRMTPGPGPTAADVLNTWEQDDQHSTHHNRVYLSPMC